MKKSISALAFTLCAAFVALAFSVRADTALQLSVAQSGGDYTTVESALAAVETMAKKGELNEKGVRLVLTGTHTATEKDGVLFGQKTVFLPDGKKLPITITGGTLILPEGSLACANDYTFTAITVPFDDLATSLFAGSGNVTLEKITVDRNGTPEYKSSFFGDTFTAAVFEGWTEKSLNLYKENGLFTSSMTLGEGFMYENTSDYPYAAVGSSTDFSAKVGTKTISADDTCAKLVVDGASLHTTMACLGSNPVGNSVLHVKKGSLYRLYALGHARQKSHTGDVTVLVEGGTFKSFVRLLSEVTLNGDLNVTLKNMDLSGNTAETDGRMIQMLFSSGSINGDLTVSMENVKADRYYGGFSSSNLTLTGDVSTTAKNCEFSKFFYGGLGKSTISGNVENTLENVTLDNFKGADECVLLGKAADYTGKKDSVGNLTNLLRDVTFTKSESSASIHLGNLNGTQNGSIFNTLENVTVSTGHAVYGGNRGGSVKGIVNIVSNSVFSSTFCGGSSGGTVTDVTNTISDSVFNDYLYLSGSGNTVKGQVENRLTGCTVSKYYTFGGVNSGKVLNNHLEYGIKNYLEDCTLHGFWGGSASSTATHKGNIYTVLASGDYSGYDSYKPYSFAGGCRNTRHEGTATSLIRGGVFHGLVAGGSIPNDKSYAKEHVGSALLTLAGGTFEYGAVANCQWGSYPEATLNVDTLQAREPLSFGFALECNSVVASSEMPTELTGSVTCKELIARGDGTMNIYGEIFCDRFTVEKDAASPAVYGKVHCKNLSLGENALLLGAYGEVTAEEVAGVARLHQTEFWLKRSYFTSPASTVILLSQEESVLGEATSENGVVRGLSSAFTGVSIVFSDKVFLRFAFDKDWAEANKDNFTFTAKCGDRTVASADGFDDLTLKDGCYTLLSDALNAAEFGNAVTYSGSLVPEHAFTLVELAENGVKIYDKKGEFQPLGKLLKAFANYAVAADNYKNGKNEPLPYEAEISRTGFTASDGFAPMTNSPAVTLTNKQLVLDEGIRIRYYFRSAVMNSSEKDKSPAGDLRYFCNCVDVTDRTTKKFVSSGFQKGYYEIVLELPAYPSQSDRVIRLMVSDQENLHLALPVDSSVSYVHEDYVDRTDAVAEALSVTSGSEELGSALLAYLQAGADYYKTQPDLSGFTYPDTFSAGYAREDVSPHGFVVDLSSSKFSHAVLDPLYATCLALWDGEELALFYSVDVRQCPEYLTDTSKQLLAEEFDIDPNKIFFNATHNHSSPNTTSQSRADMKKWYNEIFFPQMLLAARKAVLDLAPATLYTGKANSDPGTNFVRRYVNADGTFTGIHNIVPATSVVAYETEADKELRSLRFDRGEKKDILFVNWQGHAAHGAAYSYAATADFVGFLRDGVEEQLDVHFIYCNGASGNLNFTPKTTADKNAKYFTSPYFQGVGKSLVKTVKKAVDAEKAIASGQLQVTYIPHEGIVRHDDPAIVEKANACQTAVSAYQKEHGSTPSASWYQKNYGFQSKYEVSAIRARAGMGESQLLPVWAFSFGDVGMAFAPYEMFDTNGQQIRNGSPFAVTMIGGYTNGTHSYIPSAYAAPHNGYEVYTCRYVFSTGDEVASKLAAALTGQHG